jgi:hypothetical protein
MTRRRRSATNSLSAGLGGCRRRWGAASQRTTPFGLRAAATAVLSAVSAPGFGQSPPVTPVPSAGDSATENADALPLDRPEEIIVFARRSLRNLQVDVYRVEDSFFDAFNALNSRDEFDIYCRAEALPGSHIRHKQRFDGEVEKRCKDRVLFCRRRGLNAVTQPQISAIANEKRKLTDDLRNSYRKLQKSQ